MSDLFKVSQSRIKKWRTCRFAYNVKYIMNLEKQKKPNPLLRGTIIHQMLDEQTHKRDPWVALEQAKMRYAGLFEKEREEYGDIPRDIERLMKAYFKWYKKDPLRFVNIKGRRAEFPFEVELCKGIVLTGVIDGMARTSDKLKWLVENKSHKNLPSEGMNYGDIQSMLYTWAAPVYGYPELDGVCWNYIRYTPPSLPQLLKNGEMSRKASVRTTWDLYKQALLDNGLKPKDYQDMQEQLKGKEGEFFIRTYIPINPKTQKIIVDESIQTAQEIRRREGVDKTRSMGRHCDWCDAKLLCQEDMRGRSIKSTIKRHYKERE